MFKNMKLGMKISLGFGSLIVIAIALEFIIPGAFSLLTTKGRLILLYSFLICAISIFIETIGCISQWHVVFDLLFWQVLGSVVDVVILSPRPGRFLLSETE